MTTILLTTIGTAMLLISSAARLLTDMTHLVNAAKSLCASLRRSKQDAQGSRTPAEKKRIPQRTPSARSITLRDQRRSPVSTQYPPFGVAARLHAVTSIARGAICAQRAEAFTIVGEADSACLTNDKDELTIPAIGSDIQNSA